MQLNRDQCYQAMLTHDSRFDGHFFVAVKSTRIYCRPICRSKRPALERCEFYRLAAAAEVAGIAHVSVVDRSSRPARRLPIPQTG